MQNKVGFGRHRSALTRCHSIRIVRICAANGRQPTFAGHICTK